MDQQSMFRMGPTANLQVEPPWRAGLTEFLHTVKVTAGEKATLSVWPYRHDRIAYVAVDVFSPIGELSITFVESGQSKLPNSSSILQRRECQVEVVDLIDAFYLIKAIQQALDATTASVNVDQDSEFGNLAPAVQLS